LRFITSPDKVIEAGDPIATGLVKQFNQIRMPNLGVTDHEARKLLDHLAAAGAALAAPQPVAPAMPQPPLAAPQSTILWLFLALTGIIALVFAVVGLSTRNPGDVDVTRAYGLRRVFFILGATAIVVLLAKTIPQAPYARADARAERVVYVAARQFDFIFSDEPITSVADLAQVGRIRRLEIPTGTVVEFRVTSLDVNHGFGLYGPARQIVAQTQAMPGYFNRLVVRLGEPADYRVYCLEYCAAGHHVMQTSVTVK
jgi:cytochrome c oxidase subunit 2